MGSFGKRDNKHRCFKKCSKTLCFWGRGGVPFSIFLASGPYNFARRLKFWATWRQMVHLKVESKDKNGLMNGVVESGT